MGTSSSPAGTGGRFTGFPDEALAFFDGLEADNSRAYFTAHREQYEAAVRAPMLALLEALAAEFGEVSMFRPHRDIRFSRDKSPYKDHAGAVIRPPAPRAAMYYVQISAAGLMLGGGCFQVSPGQLARYREAVAAPRPGARLAAVTRELQAAGATLVAHQHLRRAPRGIDPDHPRIDLLRMKGLAATREFGAPDWLGTPQALGRIAEQWRAFAPLHAWLDRYVGADGAEDPSTG